MVWAVVKRAAPAATVAVDYGINLAGLPIGTARLAGSFDRDRYMMDVSAVLTGLVGAITGGKGSARASGSFSAAPPPRAFAIAEFEAMLRDGTMRDGVSVAAFGLLRARGML